MKSEWGEGPPLGISVAYHQGGAGRVLVFYPVTNSGSWSEQRLGIVPVMYSLCCLV